METTSSKVAHHARSSSLPSGPHPLVVHFDELLCRLKSYESATSSSIYNGLSGLLDLHDCVDSLLLMPENQKALARKCNENEANLLLDGSLRILDVCGAAKDSLSQAKEYTNKLQSLLRRRISGTAHIKEVKTYLNERKMIKKSMQKVLRNTKDVQIINKNNDESSKFIISMLREVEKATDAILESLLSFVCGSNGEAPPCKRSLLSKLMHSRSISRKEASVENEFNKVDATLQSLINTGSNKLVQPEKVQANFGHLELTIQDLEQGVESLFRTLIKKRVTLLNLLNPQVHWKPCIFV